MKKFRLMSILMIATLSVGARTVESFNNGWEFAKDGGAFEYARVPHDWAIAGPFDPEGDGDTAKLPWKGMGVYRKKLVMAEEPKGRVFLDFDGVMARSAVFVNGQVCGRGDYGYLGYRADATCFLMKGTNDVEVRCSTKELTSRFYPGGGMYRNTWIVTTDNVYIEDDSLAVETVDVLTDLAKVKVSGKVTGRAATNRLVRVSFELTDPDGRTAATGKTEMELEAFASARFERTLEVPHPQLWQMERGAKLYTLRIAIVADEYADELTRRIGLREFRFDPEEGFFLNGERIQLKGFNQHADLGPLGMAVNEGAIRRQLDIMREMGANAIRTSHNPPAPELLDACDEMGIFVWDECFDKWDDSAVKGDFVQEEFIARHLRQLVRRDRLHPCVFVWSMGNEIQTARATKFGDVGWWIGPIALGTNRERCAQYRHAIREEDRTRPVGIGSAFGHALTGRGDYLDLDIAGWNYGRVYAKAHELAPQIPVLCSESASAVSEFGFYADDLPTCKTNYAHEVHRIDSYDFNAAPWSDVPDREFVRMELDPYCSGEFVWTGIDYLGEPTPFKDSRSSYFGICDLLGFPKDRYYLYRSYWNTEDFTLHIVPGHWNFPKKIGKKIPVFVYTSAPEAELFVNGKSMGRRRKDPKAGTLDDYYSVLPRYRLMWMEVPYEPGEVKAVAYDAQGRKLGEQVRRTAGVPVKVVLTPEKKRYGKLQVVMVTLADKDGNFVPDDDRRIHFQVEGCRILAVGNSDPRGYDRFMKTDSHPLKFGRAGIFLEIEPGAKWKLTATAEGCVKAQKAAE